MGCASKLSDAVERALHKKDSIDFEYTGALCWLTVGKLQDYYRLTVRLVWSCLSAANQNRIQIKSIKMCILEKVVSCI